MIEEKETRSGGKRERPAGVPGRRLAQEGRPQSPVTDETLKMIPQDEMEDGLSMDTGALPKLEDSQIFSLPEEIAAALPSVEEESEDSDSLPDLLDLPMLEEDVPSEDQDEIPEESIPQEQEPIPQTEEADPDDVPESPTQEVEDTPSGPQPGRRILESPPSDEDASSQTLWSRAMDRAYNLTDRVLGWTEELTDRFDYMTSDPDSEGLVARAIRGSEEILEGIEDQQRETDEETEAEARRRDFKEQPRREKKPSPFVFLRSEEMPQADSTSEPVEEPEKSSEPVPEVSEEKSAPKPRPKPKAASKPKRAPRPVRTPIPKEERKQVTRSTRSLQYWFFLLVIGFFGVVGLLSPLRATTTELEDRSLTEKPELTWSGLWSGDYFGRLEQWYSDTFPMRDSLAGEYDLIHGFGFGSAELEAMETTDSETSAIPSELPDATQGTEEPSAEDQSTEEPSSEDEDSDVESLEVPTETDQGTTTA